MKLLITFIVILMVLSTGCLHYSFSGSSLPSHIKTVSIELPDNNTSKVGLEQKVYDGINSAFVALNNPSVVREGGDANLYIKLTNYQNNPDEFDAQGNVKTYKVIITAEVRFTDRKENSAIYEGNLSGIGIYNHESENENTGIDNAIRKLNESIVNNTISGW